MLSNFLPLVKGIRKPLARSHQRVSESSIIHNMYTSGFPGFQRLFCDCTSSFQENQQEIIVFSYKQFEISFETYLELRREILKIKNGSHKVLNKCYRI
jgi:hypothetical protein